MASSGGGMKLKKGSNPQESAERDLLEDLLGSDWSADKPATVPKKETPAAGWDFEESAQNENELSWGDWGTQSSG